MTSKMSPRKNSNLDVSEDSSTKSESFAIGQPVKLRSPVIQQVGDWQFDIDRHLAVAQKAQKTRLDIREFMLPAAPFTGGPLRFTNRPDLALAVIRAVDSYLLNVRPSKSRHSVVISCAHRMAKAIEFGWLNGAYRLSDWTPGLFEKLAKIIAENDWTTALQIETRVKSLLAPLDAIARADLWQIEEYPQGKICALKRSIFERLATNLGGLEQGAIRTLVAKEIVDTNPEIAALVLGNGIPMRKGRVSSVIRADLAAINLLMEAELKFVPFPKPNKRSTYLSRNDSKRTRSLGIAEVSSLLVRATSYMYNTGEALLSVCELLRDWRLATSQSGKYESMTASTFLRSASCTKILEECIGHRIEWIVATRQGGALSLGEVVQAFQSAAFVIIAFMTARRRDEIIHPRIGIHSEALLVIDEDLSIFQCEFYIEKTLRDYAPFYVNKMTKDAISFLSRLSRVAREMYEINGGTRGPAAPRLDTIFSIPQFDKFASKRGLRWFDFGLANRSRSRAYTRQALLEEGPTVRFSAHMLRRAHALIFHYRHEDSTLIALQQQLQHFDLATTQIYVTDPGNANDSGFASYGPLTPVQRAALGVEHQKIAMESNVVAKERLHKFVEDILEGRRAHAGGYPRLVKRFHQALLHSVSYRELDKPEQRQLLSAALLRKGHLSKPMSYGNCMTGTSHSRLRGRCHSDTTNGPDRAKASPTMCSGCPYFVSLQEHLVNLKTYESALKKRSSEISPASLQARSISIEIRSLANVIAHQQARLAKEFSE